MNPHIYERKIVLERPREEVFEFFSNAGNLDRITPRDLGFRILTELPIIMKKGAIIDYELRLNGIPFRWRTEITEWDPPYRFVDTQLKGPYKMWVHTHAFEDLGDKTLMTDTVKYLSPGGFLEIIPHKLFVEKKVSKIFEFREEILKSVLD